jgi:hypothetical protein
MGYRRPRAGSLAQVSSFEGEEAHKSRAKARTSRSGRRRSATSPGCREWIELARGRLRPSRPLPARHRPRRHRPEHAVVGDPEQALHLGHVRAVHVRRRKPQGSRLLGVHPTAGRSLPRRSRYVKPIPSRRSRSSSVRRRSAAAPAPRCRSARCASAAARRAQTCPRAQGGPRPRSRPPRCPR